MMPMPNWVSNARKCAGGSAADALRQNRMADTSACGAAPSSKYEIMVGTTLIQVQRDCVACCQKLPAENRGGMARLPPWASGASMVTAKALMWYSGSTASTRSRGERACSVLMDKALADRLAWVSITPLGTPVVPEVYMSRASASGLGSGRSVVALGKMSCAGSKSGLHTKSATGRASVASTARTRSAQSGLATTSLQSLCSST